MTRIDGGDAGTLEDRIRSLDAPVPDVWAAFDAEFFVEWQVADGSPSEPASTPEVDAL